MRALGRTVVNLFIAGLVFLLPVIVVLVVVTKAWTAVSTFGTRIAGVFGVKQIIGLGSDTAFTGVLLILLCVACGWLVRFSLVNAFHDAIEKRLIRYIPGYQTYKADAEDKLHKKIRILPYTSALVRHSGFWRPAYVIEQDAEGHSVIFLPDIPHTDQGQVLLATREQIQIVPSLSANQLDATLKQMGKGLLAEHKVVPAEHAPIE